MNREAFGLYCDELAALIERCEENDPGDQAVEEIERHVASCPICQRAESTLAATMSSYRAHALPGISQRFEETVVDRLCQTGRSDAETDRQD